MLLLNLPLPPMTEGDEKRQYFEVRRYLFRLVESLNNALEGFSPVGAVMEAPTQATGISESVKQAISTASQELKAIIVKNAKDTDAEFASLISTIQSHIRQGVVRYEEEVPVLGLALGNHITVTGETETIGETTYDVIDTTGDLMTWTPEKLSLIFNGLEVASLGNSLAIGSTSLSEAQLQALLELLEEQEV